MKSNFCSVSRLCIYDGFRSGKYIKIANPLKVLRNFGHIITHLRIDFHRLLRNIELCTEIENYLARYCSDSLKYLFIICNIWKIAFKDLQKPLKKITHLTIRMPDNQNFEHIRFLNKNNLPNMKNVHIIGLDNECGNLDFENIEYFNVSASELTIYSLSFDNLKHLILTGLYAVNDSLCDCIARMKDLKTLKLVSCWQGFDPDPFYKILKLPNILSNIVEIQFQYYDGMSPDNVLCFLKQSRNLRKLSIPYATDKPRRRHYSRFLHNVTLNLDVEWTHHVREITRSESEKDLRPEFRPSSNPNFSHHEPNFAFQDEHCLIIERMDEKKIH